MSCSRCFPLIGRAVLVILSVVLLVGSVVGDRVSALQHAPGTDTLLPFYTPTPTPEPSVRAIYAIPSDRAYDSFLEDSIRNLLLGVQAWYGEQLGGKTFALGNPLPHICHLAGTSDMYDGAGGWAAVIEGLQHCEPVEHFSEWHTWVIYVSMRVPCQNGDTAPSFELGRGGGGIAILHADARGLQQEEFRPCESWPLPQSLRLWEGGLAHELGHAFGLPHPPECVDSPCVNKSVMWAGMYDYPSTYLSAIDKAFLASLPAFND